MSLVHPKPNVDRHIERVRELAETLWESRERLREAGEAISAHPPGPIGKPDLVYQALGVTFRDANDAIRQNREEIRMVLGWIAWELGVSAKD